MVAYHMSGSREDRRRYIAGWSFQHAPLPGTPTGCLDRLPPPCRDNTNGMYPEFKVKM